MSDTFRRPELFLPLSVRFASGRTGTALQNRFGLPGLAVWAAYLAACKLNRPEGEIVYASETEGWAILGLRGHEPEFSLQEFFGFTGNLKKTRRTRSGQLTYVVCTPWGRWTKTQKQEAERRRKARLRGQSERDTERTQDGKLTGQESDLEVEVEEEPPLTPPPGGNRQSLTKRELRRYTGCRHTRGTHGSGYKHDPLGTDKPPPDWPYDKPTLDEVLAAQAAANGNSADADIFTPTETSAPTR